MGIEITKNTKETRCKQPAYWTHSGLYGDLMNIWCVPLKFVCWW